MCNLPPDWFKGDGTDFELNLAQACGVLLDPGDGLVVRCAGDIPDDASGTITNRVEVTCAPDDGDNCESGPVFCGNVVEDDAEVQIKPCDFEVTKDVTCDDPRDPGASFEPETVEALPGSEVGFRVLNASISFKNL